MGNKQGNTVVRKKNYNDYTVMLVGKMGAGKSSLGNFLLRKDHFEAADSMSRVTDRNMCECTSLPGGLTLRIIDTPGFGDFRESEEVKKDLADAFYEAKDGVDAFLFVISAAERIGKEMVSHFEMFAQFMEHEHFYDYVIPVFTKVDQRLQKKGEKDIYSYEKQERLIHNELENDQLMIFKDKIIGKAKQNWMCVSNLSKDTFYYKVITRKLIQTIESIRIQRNGMVCTTRILEKVKDIDEMERIKNKKAEEEEIRRIVLFLILQILIKNMQGEEFDEMFGNDTERQKREAENRSGQDSQTGALGTAEDLKK